MRGWLGSGLQPSALGGLGSALGGLAQASPLSLLDAPVADNLLEHERTHNKLIVALRDDFTLREVLLNAACSVAPDFALYLLLPQSSTLEDVEVTLELVQTHLVRLQRGVARGYPRAFTSLNGLCGTCRADGEITVNGRLRRAADTDSALGGSVGGWAQDGRGAAVAQLESQIVVLRESQLQASAKLPLRVPVGLLIVSDPLFFPGCGWKLPLALRQCTHRFRETALDELPLSDLPALLCEYQIMARAWLEGQGLGGEAEEPPKPRDAIVIAPPPPPATPPVVAAPSAAYAATALLSGRDSSPLSSHTRMRFAQISAAAEALLRQPAPSKQAPSASAAALLRSLLGPTERESGGSSSEAGSAIVKEQDEE